MKGVEKQVQKIVAKINGCTVLVEGKRDEQALRRVGVTSKIILFGRSAAQTLRQVESDCNVLLLYDFDEEGERKERQLREMLSPFARVDSTLRKKFRSLFGCRTIEQLPSALRRLEEQALKQGESTWEKLTWT